MPSPHEPIEDHFIDDVMGRDDFSLSTTFFRRLCAQAKEANALRRALRNATDALEDMGDFWAYGMAKTEGAQPTTEDMAAVTRLSKAARKAITEARLLVERQSHGNT